jgi:hypothetical protein
MTAKEVFLMHRKSRDLEHRCSECGHSFKVVGLFEGHSLGEEKFEPHVKEKHSDITFPKMPNKNDRVMVPGLAFGDFKVTSVNSEKKTVYLRSESEDYAMADDSSVRWAALSYLSE